jgi:hypothetical protein
MAIRLVRVRTLLLFSRVIATGALDPVRIESTLIERVLANLSARVIARFIARFSARDYLRVVFYVEARHERRASAGRTKEEAVWKITDDYGSFHRADDFAGGRNGLGLEGDRFRG